MTTGKVTPVGTTYSSVFLMLMLALSFSVTGVSANSLTTFSVSDPLSHDLVGLFSSLRWRVGDRVFGQAVIGREGWIYFSDKLTMQDYQHTIDLKTGPLLALQTQFDRFNEDLASKSITLLVVIMPDKSSIYPQYMPSEIPVISQPSRLDDFLSFMRAHGHTKIVDLRPVLLKASATQQIYYKTDTHWNDLGAYYAYTEIMNALSAAYPLLKPHPLSDYEYQTGPRSVRNLANLTGLWSLQEEKVQLVPRFQNQTVTIKIPLSDFQDMWFTTNRDSDLPRLLVLRDSFYIALAKFIEPHFSQTTVVHYSRLGDNATFDDWVRLTRPNVVIVEMLETYLKLVMPVPESRP